MNRRAFGHGLGIRRLMAVLALASVVALVPPGAGRAAAPTPHTYSTFFTMYCYGVGPVCTPPWTITVITAQRLTIDYQVPGSHCSSFKLLVLLDKKVVWSKRMGSLRTPDGPLDTGPINLVGIARGAHVVGLQAVSIKGSGCTVTRIATWGGTVTLTGVTLPSPHPFLIYCKTTVTVCQPPWTTTVKTGRLLQIDYHDGIQCAPIQLRILLDGRVVGTKDMGYAGDPKGRPIDTGPITIAPVTPGTHVVGLQAVGIKGGCNGPGTLSAWSGTVFIVT